MNKRDFESFIKQNLKDLPLEKQQKLLETIQYSWLPDIRQKLNNKIEKSYIKCSKCGKYSLKKNFNVESKNITNYGEIVYTDCGYGDDDEIADVTYSICYYICPKCGGMTEKDRWKISETNRRTRK